MKGYELSPEATDDLQEIWVYIANDNPIAADKLEHDIYAACELLAKNPRLGHGRSDLTDEPVLFWPVRGQYMVIYLPDTEPLKIVRILQGARNFKRPEQIASSRGKSVNRQLTSWSR
jgi:plasmid stabilization system protein ParE